MTTALAAPLMPAAPRLGDHDLRLIRFVLTPGPRAGRRAKAGLRVEDIRGADQKVCDLLGAQHLPQASALAAAYRLVTTPEIGMPTAPGAGLRMPPRVRRALELLLSGLTDDQIADELEVARDTAHGYLTEAVQELGAGRRPQAAFLAVTCDLVLLSAISPLFPAVVLSKVPRR